MVRTITAAAALTIAGSAMAVPTGAHWEMIDNSTTAGPGGVGLADNWMTFDLYVDLEPGDVVGAIAFQNGGGNSGLITDGTYFQVGAPFGSDSFQANQGFIGFVDNLEYDTSVAMNSESLSFAASMDWNPAGASGAWFSSNQAQVPGPVFVARITVSNDTTFLGGQSFVSGTGPNGNFGQEDENLALGVVDIPNAKIPTPGALALFGLAGAAATRRRR